MSKHYEEKVTAKYLGHRQYEVTVSEIAVTKNGKWVEARETVRKGKEIFYPPTLLSSFLTGEALDESYRKRLYEIEEKFKLYDFDKINIFDISEALENAAREVDRVLPPLYMF